MPLTVKQTKSMHEMQGIQPKLKALQEKYKNDKEKLQEETLKFYQENKVNPFGGCLPLLCRCRSSSRCSRCSARPAKETSRRAPSGTCRVLSRRCR